MRCASDPLSPSISVSAATMLIPVIVPFMVVLTTMPIPTLALVHRWSVNAGRALVVLRWIVVIGYGLVHRTLSPINQERLLVYLHWYVDG